MISTFGTILQRRRTRNFQASPPEIDNGETTLSAEQGTSPSQSVERKHLRVSSKECGVYVCAKCLFSTSDGEAFREHIAMHVVKNSVQCRECGLCFRVLPGLKRHLLLVHKVLHVDDYVQRYEITAADIDPDIEKQLRSLDSEAVDTDTKRSKRKSTVVSSPSPTSPTAVRPRGAGGSECNVCYKRFPSDDYLRAHMRLHGMVLVRSTRRNISQHPPNRADATKDSEPDTALCKNDS